MRSLELFAREVAQTDNRSARVSLSKSANPFAEVAYREFRHAQAMLGGGERLDRDQAILTTLHVLWKLVPEKLFTSCDPDYRKLVEQSLAQYGLEDVSAETRRNLQVIFKRLRSYERDGRQASSLDLSRPEHVELLATQSGRCAVCRYEFTEIDIGWGEDEGFLSAVQPHNPRCPEELVLEQINRSPVLDHIIPVFLGGDSEANWQIACWSCNAGKSDAWTAVARTGFVPPSTPSSARRLTSSLRYVVLATHDSDWRLMNELIVVKRDPNGVATFPNLVAVELLASR